MKVHSHVQSFFRLLFGFAFVAALAACGDDTETDGQPGPNQPTVSQCAALEDVDDGAGVDCSFVGAEACPSVTCLCNDGSQIGTRSCVNGACAGLDACDDACSDSGGYLCTGDCYDDIQNGDETGVDCGGRCDACVTADAPTCDDGIQNGDEEGVDCGGSCPACQPSQPAEPTCDDGIKNGDEEGVDCGGSCKACPPKSCQQSTSCSRYRSPETCEAQPACAVAFEGCGHTCEQYPEFSSEHMSCVSISGKHECRFEGTSDREECERAASCFWYADCTGICGSLDEQSCESTEGCNWR